MLRRSPLLDTSAALARRAAIESRSALYAWRAGMLALERPDRALAIFRAMDRLGQLGAAIAIAAIRHGERIGLVDELGSVTFAELDGRSSALACGLRARGLRSGRLRRDPVPQPPRLPRCDLRRGKGRCADAVPEHRLRRPTAARRVRA